MNYKRYPYSITFKDGETYCLAMYWALGNLMRGLWTADYTRPNALMFTREEDAVIVALRFS